ncbi:MAG: glycosyltransferase family 2 protein [Ignavibacteria bacterium]|nr:glycosyltransferase family 2 protein [Ignavibacteria bacterium]
MISVKKQHIPFFSVIVTAYNRSHIIDRALSSLINQVEQDWECIIVDDGSTDDVSGTVNKYINNDDRFRFIQHSHRGQALTKNAGVLSSSGLFITFLDSDDEYATDHLATRKAMLEEYPHLDLLHGGVAIIGDPFVPDMNDPSLLIHLKECTIGGTFFFKKTSIQALGGFPVIHYGDDTALYTLAEKAGYVIAKTDHPSYIYHREELDSLCNTMKDKS